MKAIHTLYKKEVLDASRDKRSLMASVYFAIGGPILFCLLFMAMINNTLAPSNLKITIEGAEHAPALVSYLRTKGIEQGHGEDTKAIRLNISSDYRENMNQGRPAMVTLEADYANEKLRDGLKRVENELQRYSAQIASLRLISRGIDPNIVQPLEFNKQDLATPDSKAGLMYGVATLSIILSLFYGAMNLAIDSSAGERERNSLSLLLSHPVSTLQIVIAKIASIATLGMVSLLLVLLVSKLVYPMVPWEELGFSISLNVDFILFALLIGLPLAAMAASIMVFASFLAKTFKEAQSYLAMVLLLPVGLSMARSYNLGGDVLSWLPVSGQQSALIAYIKGNSLAMPELLSASLATLAIAAVLAWITSKQLRSEKVVFGL
ncbi:ABC transporter permease [Pseudoalteromonas fenneropenaei]|uniref:ABC transporter permease n=1 Tax=Pseudoalteromonas fenneropenaei TaxID=1737459 RepID=A0ABV7CQ96_9GAMM